MVGCRRGWKRRYYGGSVRHAGYWRLRQRRMHGAVDGLCLVHGIHVQGRRLLEWLLGHGLGSIERLRLWVMMHVGLLVYGVILIVLRRHIWLTVGIMRIRVLLHVRSIHVLSRERRMWLRIEVLPVVLWLMSLVPATMLSARLDGRRHRHCTWTSVGTRRAGHVEIGLTGIACTTLHGWLPSRQAVGHLAGLGGDGSQCRSLLRPTHDDQPSPRMLRRC